MKYDLVLQLVFQTRRNVSEDPLILVDPEEPVRREQVFRGIPRNVWVDQNTSLQVY